MNPNLDNIAGAFGFGKKTQYDTHTWGTVKSINSDGSYQVQLNASTVYTRCAKLCFANVGDRVFVCILANGTCAAIARLGGSDSSVVRGINITGGKANDTREFWQNQPNGLYWFNRTEQLNGQPSQWVIVEHMHYGSEIHQLLHVQSNGASYRRGANSQVTDMPGFVRITDDSQNPALLRYYNDSSHGNYAGLAMHTLADTGWIRTPKPGLLPWDNTGGGICDLGSGTSWQFRNIYGKNFYRNGSLVADHVVASGTSGDWRYWKFASKLAICYLTRTDNLYVDTSGHPCYSSGLFPQRSYPFAFSSKPTVIMGVNGKTGQFWASQSNDGTTTKSPSWRLYAGSIQASSSCTWSILAIGLWS